MIAQAETAPGDGPGCWLLRCADRWMRLGVAMSSNTPMVRLRENPPVDRRGGRMRALIPAHTDGTVAGAWVPGIPAHGAYVPGQRASAERDEWMLGRYQDRPWEKRVMILASRSPYLSGGARRRRRRAVGSRHPALRPGPLSRRARS